MEWAVLRRETGEDMNVAVKRLRRDLISSDQVGGGRVCPLSAALLADKTLKAATTSP